MGTRTTHTDRPDRLELSTNARLARQVVADLRQADEAHETGELARELMHGMRAVAAHDRLTDRGAVLSGQDNRGGYHEDGQPQ